MIYLYTHSLFFNYYRMRQRAIMGLWHVGVVCMIWIVIVMTLSWLVSPV